MLHLAPGPDPSAPPRIGFVVGRTVGGAVVRNRVRRRLRHLVGAQLQTLPPASELVIRALPPAAGLSSTELEVELTRCLERVRRSSEPRSNGTLTEARS